MLTHTFLASLRWLDTGMDDKQISRNLGAVGKISFNQGLDYFLSLQYKKDCLS